MFGSHLCIPRNETVQPHYFQDRIIMFCLPIPIVHSCICERFMYSQAWPGYLVQQNMWTWTDPGIIFIAHRHMKVRIGTKVEQSFLGNTEMGVSLQCMYSKALTA
jgi:hypothetical protein